MNDVKAKDASLLGQILAGCWIAGWAAYKFISKGVMDIDDIVLSGISIAACFTPVYFSILMDKIKDIRAAKQEKPEQ